MNSGLVILLALIAIVTSVSGLALSRLAETPEVPPGDICQALKGAHPKKDVEIQPYCPDETPTPEPTPASPGKKVEK